MRRAAARPPNRAHSPQCCGTRVPSEARCHPHPFSPDTQAVEATTAAPQCPAMLARRLCGALPTANGCQRAQFAEQSRWRRAAFALTRAQLAATSGDPRRPDDVIPYKERDKKEKMPNVFLILALFCGTGAMLLKVRTHMPRQIIASHPASQLASCTGRMRAVQGTMRGA